MSILLVITGKNGQGLHHFSIGGPGGLVQAVFQGPSLRWSPLQDPNQMEGMLPPTNP